MIDNENKNASVSVVKTTTACSDWAAFADIAEIVKQPDPFVDVCRAFLRSYRVRAGRFPNIETEHQAEYCSLGAKSQILNRCQVPVPYLRVAVVESFAKLEAMLHPC